MTSRGFTLIELLIAISIMAGLSVVGAATYQGIAVNNRDQIRMRDLTSLQQTLELYRHEKHYYPAVLTSLVPTYLDAIPLDARNPYRTYFYRALDKTGALCTPGPGCVSYQLCASKEGTKTFPDPGQCSAQNCGTNSDGSINRCQMSVVPQ